MSAGLAVIILAAVAVAAFLMRLLAPHKGHHRDKFTLAPAPDAAPGQAEDAAPSASPRAAAAAPLPQPRTATPPAAASPGLGQPSEQPAWVVFPDQTAWAAHHKRIDGLAAPGHCAGTGSMPALVGRHYTAHEAWRDQPAQVTS